MKAVPRCVPTPTKFKVLVRPKPGLGDTADLEFCCSMTSEQLLLFFLSRCPRALSDYTTVCTEACYSTSGKLLNMFYVFMSAP